MNKNTLKNAWKIFEPTLAIMIISVIFSQSAYIFSYPTEDELFFGYDGMRHIIVTGLVVCLSYYSFVRILAIYNAPLRDFYFSLEGKPRFFGFLFRTPCFWLDMCGYAFLVFAFSLEKTFPLFLDVFHFDGWGWKLKVFAITLPIFALINILARYNALQFWLQEGSKGRNSVSKESNTMYMTHNFVPIPAKVSLMRFMSSTPMFEEGEKSWRYTKISTGKEKRKTIVSIAFTYVFFAIYSRFIYQIIMSILLPFVGFFLTWKTLAVGGGLVLLFLLYRRLKAYRIRIKFLNSLKQVCKERKYKLSEVKYPYKSVFRFYKGENFTVTLSGRTFSCKMISAVKPSVPLCLNGNGLGMYIHSLSFARVQWFQYSTNFNFAYESEHPQILIINPSGKFIHTVHKGKLQELDNGDFVGKYRVYTAGAFLRTLERDCLHKT